MVTQDKYLCNGLILTYASVGITSFFGIQHIILTQNNCIPLRIDSFQTP